MTTLSRLLVDPRSPRVRGDLVDAHGMHRRILSAFPDVELKELGAREKYEVLYRIEPPRSGSVPILVQSATTPDWSRLPAGYLTSEVGEAAVRKDLSSFINAIQVGQRRRFRLRANATRSVKTSHEPARGKRVELIGEQSALAWLQSQSKAAGFELLVHDELELFEHDEPAPHVRITSESKVYGTRQGKRVTFGSFLFEGLLEVKQVELLRQALRRGIGRAKGYGFGLLSLGPPA